MLISIDLVPCVEFDDCEPATPASYYGVDDCNFYAYCKSKNVDDPATCFFPVACTEVGADKKLLRMHPAWLQAGQSNLTDKLDDATVREQTN